MGGKVEKSADGADAGGEADDTLPDDGTLDDGGEDETESQLGDDGDTDEGSEGEPADEAGEEDGTDAGTEGTDAASLANIAAALFGAKPAATEAPKASNEPAPIPQDLLDARKALADDLSDEGIKAVDAIIARLAKAEAAESQRTKAVEESNAREYQAAVIGWFDKHAPEAVFGKGNARTDAHAKMILDVHAGALQIAEANAAQRKANPKLPAITADQALSFSMQAYLLATGKGKPKAAGAAKPAAKPATRIPGKPAQTRAHAAESKSTDPRSAGVAAIKAALGLRG